MGADDDDWVLVRRRPDKDIWSPSSMDAGEEPRPLNVTFSGPAQYWTDAIPIGNGRLGAMVWGGVATEILQLNEDTLWTGVPGNYTDPNAPKVLAEVRKLVNDGKYVEATEAGVGLFGNLTEVYQLLGDIKLDFSDHLDYVEETYQRELDLDTARALVKYRVGDVEYTREHFVSYPDQVVVTKISGSKPGSLSFVVSLDSKLPHNSYINGKNQLVMEGTCPGKRIPPNVHADDNPDGIQFSAVLDVRISDGEGVINIVDENKLNVKGSSWSVLLLAAQSSFEGPFIKPSNSRKKPTSECLSALDSRKNTSYSDIYSHHLNDYQNLFHRVSLQLSHSSSTFVKDRKEMKQPQCLPCELCPEQHQGKIVSTSERVKSFQTDEDPSLVELLFQFGRYLLISSSRPGTQVANLQGIWNAELEPKWDAAPHLNINLEMNYWPCLPCNLSECQEPLFDFLTSLSINGSKTAKINYIANGWVVHHTSDIWAKSSPHQGVDSDDVKWSLWPMGGAWLCTHLWEHYSFTLDKDFLKDKAYPLLEGCTQFLLDWLIEGHGGYLETNPSTSPEHHFLAPDGRLASVSYSSTMDMEIIREVFNTIVSAAEVLDKTGDELIAKVQKALPRLYPPRIAEDGSIMEWALDFVDPEPNHRHLSHLFGLFPGNTITVENSPDLCEAAVRSLHKRGENGPGWSTTWKTALWARLRNSEHSYRMVKHLFQLVDPDPDQTVAFKGGLYSNLFGAHPPFQIDCNFGFSAGIAEMLVQSSLTDLYLLPALPRDKWVNGCVKGLKARGGLMVSISWREGDLCEVGLWSQNKSCSKILHYSGTKAAVYLSAGRVYTFNKCLERIDDYPLLARTFLGV